VARSGFLLLALVPLAVVCYFVFVRYNESIYSLLFAADVGETGSWTEIQQTLVALAAPVVIALLISGVCVALAMLLQRRARQEFAASMASFSRMAREGRLVDPRSRGLTQILEETLANARQAFSMQLWISRTLFIVGIVMVFCFMATLIAGNSYAIGGTILSALLAFTGAALLNPQRQIANDLANVTQLEAILGGYVRQAAVLEDHLYRLMEDPRMTVEGKDKLITDGVQQLNASLSSAVQAIDDHVEAGDRKMSPTERWLLNQLAEKAPSPNGKADKVSETTL